MTLSLVYKERRTNRHVELEGTALLLDGGLELKAWWGEWRTFAVRDAAPDPLWWMVYETGRHQIDPINVFLTEQEPLVLHARRADGAWQEWSAEIDAQLSWDIVNDRLVLTREGADETLVHEADSDCWYSPATHLRYEQVLLGARQTVDDLVRGLSPLPPLPPLGPRLRLSPLAARLTASA